MESAATAISLEEFRQERARAEVRRRLHERIDCWLDAVEGQVREQSPTLEEVTQVVFAMRGELTGMVAEALVEQRRVNVDSRGENAQRGRQSPSLMSLNS